MLIWYFCEFYDGMAWNGYCALLVGWCGGMYAARMRIREVGKGAGGVAWKKALS
jgi:hypothetical protein